MSILRTLQERFRPALLTLVDPVDELLGMIRPAQDPQFGDYQANVAMPLGKRLGHPPRDVAQQLVARLAVDDFCAPPTVAGPGFINLRLRDEWLSGQLQRLLADPRLGIPQVAVPRTYVIDYSSPNVAKPMHVGHIRSTVIGDALYRLLQFVGHRVISDNHLGDWGTQFGMIIYGYKHFLDTAQYRAHPVSELGRLYKLVRQLIDYHAAVRELPQAEQRLAEAVRRHHAVRGGADQAPRDKQRAAALREATAAVAEAEAQCGALRATRAEVEQDPTVREVASRHAGVEEAVLQETARLHAGDAENVALWQAFLPHCAEDIRRIYQRLDVRFDHALGESFYHGRLPGVVDSLLQRGLARESHGAVCVFLPQFETPMIIRKKDGAFLYATTDLATIEHRMETWHPDAILYVVDHRQSEHFDKLFAAARLWGYEQVELRHISFGTVLGEDGRPYRTRSGAVVGLEGLLDEAIRRAYHVVATNDDSKPGGPELSEAERQTVARVVGHAAIKYADLAHNRTSDYVFSYDKMVALDGNTATYMQYSYARTQSIFQRGQIDVAALRARQPEIVLAEPTERDLALELLQFGDALDKTLEDFRPNVLTAYLFSLATRFSRFYQQCDVLRAPSERVRESRLALCDLAGRTIARGLALLGIGVVERM
ncbi:MAG: arginine--tRNA ligase [Pirellulaceae bacterium]|nr:arginine--tRNA ligase [Pirellulaceae bacterium]